VLRINSAKNPLARVYQTSPLREIGGDVYIYQAICLKWLPVRFGDGFPPNARIQGEQVTAATRWVVGVVGIFVAT